MQVATESNNRQTTKVIQEKQVSNFQKVDFSNKKNLDDQKLKFVTFGFMNDIAKKIRKTKTMDYSDIQPISKELQSYHSAVRLTKQYNKSVIKNQEKGKKAPSLITTALGANKARTIWLFIGVPLMSLCGIASPIGVRQFTTYLNPGLFYDCDRIFTDTYYEFDLLNYSAGLNKTGVLLWGYVLLIFFSQMVRVLAESMVVANTSRISVSLSSGMLDIMYNKILALSDQARQSSATGNLVNLLFSDTQRMQMFIMFMFQCIQMPIDFVANLIYLAVEINPVALVGLCGYLILVPVVFIILMFIVSAQKRIMGFKDMRIKRSSEILNGIKVIKLFALEEIQEKRVFNTREREIKMLFSYSQYMSFLSVVSSLAAPIMTLIAFAGMIGQNSFDLSSAFTTMYQFQYLAQVILMLPMIMTMMSEAIISGNRMTTFIQLPEKDPGIVVRVNKLSSEEKSSLKMSMAADVAIKTSGKPSFTWALAQDQVVPPILDPLFKENQRILKQIKMQYPKFKVAASQAIQFAIQQYQNSIDSIILEDVKQLKIDIDTEITDFLILDRWCTELDVTYLRRLESLESYDINKFLVQPQDSQLLQAKKQYLQIKTMQVYMSKENISNIKDMPNVLHNLDFEIKKQEIIGICGQVGHGKSSFFNAILGELRLSSDKRKLIDQQKQLQKDLIKFDYNQFTTSANDACNLQMSQDIPHVYIDGTVAFFSQQPCIFSKTIRDNITFGKEYIQEKYDRIVDICCLIPDFDMLEGGDQTEVGGKGVNLSGGQKARIALARAVYSDADILLLDDPLSAVDSHVGARLWNEVIIGYLKSRGTTVVIASHQTHFFQTCDRVIQIVNGQIAAFDTPLNLQQQGVHIMGLTDEGSSSIISTQGISVYDKKMIIKPKDRVKKTENVQKVHKDGDAEKGKLVEQEGVSGSGNISGKSYLKWFKAGSAWLAILTVVALIIQTAISQYQSIMITHWATDKYGWSSPAPDDAMEQAFKNMKCQQKQGEITDCKVIIANSMQNVMIKQFESTQKQSYAMQGVQMCAQLEYQMEMATPSGESYKYLGLYAGMTILSAVLSYIGNIAFCRFSLSAAQTLHNNMLSKLLRVPMLFFDTTPQGRILNRLSKDIDSIDSNIMRYMQMSLTMGLMIAGMIITIAATNYPALIVIIPALIIFLILFFQFRSVFPHIKRLESISRSPVFNTCQETVESLICIRAYDMQREQITQFRELVNINTSMLFSSTSITRWLAIRLGTLSSFFAALVAVAALLISPVSQEISSYTGVIVSNGQSISMLLLQFVTTMVNLEGEMASVERVLEYSEMEQEGNQGYPENKAADWPKKENCEIEVKDLQFRYNKKQDFILKGINFKLNPKEHIGIVGRTGAGKSTITVSMFRLAEAENKSQILIDGVNILKIDLIQARRSLAIIPQEPFLFSGTLRQNLCPVSQATSEGVKPPEGMKALSDEELWYVLEQVQMKDYFMNQPGGLDARIAANGDNLSAGQKQLVCVARALMRKVGCVILDEATAQVDRENDKLIQDTIRRTLGNTAVLSIAHRLDTIIDFDRIIVMDAGRIAEFDSPANLLQIENGVFAQLIDRTGPEMSAKLRKAAIQADQQRKAGLKVNVEI